MKSINWRNCVPPPPTLEEEKKFNRRSISSTVPAQICWAQLNVMMWEARNKASLDMRQEWIEELWHSWEATVGMPRKAPAASLPLRAKLWILRTFTDRVLLHHYRPLHRMLDVTRLLGLGEASRAQFQAYAASLDAKRIAEMYDVTARIYESRGQIQEALDMWRRAEPLNDPTVDSLACQSILKHPETTYGRSAAQQQRWVDRHIRVGSVTPTPNFPSFDGRRKLRIGYHCSFMDADTIRFIMQRPIQAHDRSKFEVFGYAPMDLPGRLHSAFDVVRKTSPMSDDAFLDLVRSDRIDVFVELSGFSPGHRFGAMANRCAPVQISYLNHFATSRVPNVDYVFGDEICTPPGSAARTVSETIHLLPHCLLCYDDRRQRAGLGPSVAGEQVRDLRLLRQRRQDQHSAGRLWCELMRRVPNSIMLIQNSMSSRTIADSCDRFAREVFHRTA